MILDGWFGTIQDYSVSASRSRLDVPAVSVAVRFSQMKSIHVDGWSYWEMAASLHEDIEIVRLRRVYKRSRRSGRRIFLLYSCSYSDKAWFPVLCCKLSFSYCAGVFWETKIAATNVFFFSLLFCKLLHWNTNFCCQCRVHLNCIYRWNVGIRTVRSLQMPVFTRRPFICHNGCNPATVGKDRPETVIGT